MSHQLHLYQESADISILAQSFLISLSGRLFSTNHFGHFSPGNNEPKEKGLKMTSCGDYRNLNSFGSRHVHPDSFRQQCNHWYTPVRLRMTSTMTVSSSTERCRRTHVSAQNVHVTPSAGFIFVAIKADCAFVSVLTAVLTSNVVRLYSLVMSLRRCVNDCIKAWPTSACSLRWYLGVVLCSSRATKGLRWCR
jgi:hypothetical protein